MNLLITGAAGFVGSCFARRAAINNVYDKIVLLDKMGYASDIRNVQDTIDNKRIIICPISLNQEEILRGLLKTHEITHIAHFAASSHVDNSIKDPWPFIEDSVIGTYNLLETVRKVDPKIRIHIVSTDEVFGALGEHDRDFWNTNLFKPSSPYAASKAAADCLAMAWHKTFDLQITRSHCTNNFGPYQHPEKLIPKAITCCLLGKPIPIYSIGAQSRDWIHVEDHCLAVELILMKSNPGSAYMVGCTNEWTNTQVVELICNTINKISEEISVNSYFNYPNIPKDCCGLITFIKDPRPGHDLRYAVDWQDLRNDLQPKYKYSKPFHLYDFEKAMLDTVWWYVQNKEWWIEKV